MDERIRNAAELSRRGVTELRSIALRVAAAGLRACDPRRATRDAVDLMPGGIAFQGRQYSLRPGSRVVVVGSGKATWPIASTLESVLGDRLDGGVVAVRDIPAGSAPLERVQTLVADHPLPTERSEAAATRILGLVDDLRADDLVIAAFTGGSSSLTSMAPDGVTHTEKRRLHELLLGSGASIAEVNTVRKHVSSFKGGRVAARAAPARLVNLTISDVAGDVLDVLTDPSVQDTTTPEDAVDVLRRRGLWDVVPDAVRAHLANDAAESPRLAREPQTVLLSNGARVCEAMKDEARAAGWDAQVVSTELEGEASELGRFLAEKARGRNSGERPSPLLLVGCGGEATVTLGPDSSSGGFGTGGPNQEVALAVALGLRPAANVAGVFLDTDGLDGGTDVAGAVIDELTVERARSLGVDLEAALAGHRSGEAFATLGDQVITGPTHTNVNDLFVLAVG